MTLKDLKKTEEAIKDLILFDSSWKNKKLTGQFPQKVLQRLKIYKELVKNSFDSLFTSIYPHTYKLIKKDWTNIYKKYLKECPPDSPMLNRVAKKLPKFLSKQTDVLKKYPFISELAQFEWLEVEVYEREETNGKRKSIEQLNPIHEIYKFEYPITKIVNMIDKKQLVKNIKKENLNLIIYRDPKDLKVRLFELAPGTLAYIELLKRGLTHNEAIDILIDFFKINNQDKNTFKKNMGNLKKTLKQNQIIVTN